MTSVSAQKIVPVLLSGGSGSRLWPMSRELYPKQFLPLCSDNTMLQDTALRVGDAPAFAPPLVVCNQEHRFLVAEQLRQIGVTPRGIVLEPMGRNTAAACAVAALAVAKDDPEALLRELPADHRIRDGEVMKVPYMAVVGKREAEAGTIAVRARGAGKKQEILPVDAFIERLGEEIRTRALSAG